MSDTPKDSFIAAMREMGEACPCRLPGGVTYCRGFCACMGFKQGNNCSWPRHAAIRKAVEAFQNLECAWFKGHQPDHVEHAACVESLMKEIG